VQDRKLSGWKVDGREESAPAGSEVAGVSAASSEDAAKAALIRNFEFRLPLSWLLATPGSSRESAEEHKSSVEAIPPTSRLRLRFSLWQNHLPVDALPMEGWIDLQLLSEPELHSGM
jgi:hypothetical protein